jgi:hypothetical protein
VIRITFSIAILIAMFFFNQGLLEKFQSKCAEKASIKVWLQKVKHPCTSAQIRLIPEDCTGAPLFNQGPGKNFQCRVCLKKI